jgi:hypothetical protein
MLSLDQARANENQAEHAYQNARRSGDTLAAYHAMSRRAAAVCQREAAEAAANPQGYARQQAESHHQHAGAHAYGLFY